MLSDSQRAAFAARLRRGREGATGGIPRRPADMGDPPPSFGQEQLWFIDRFAPGLATYNIPMALRLTGELDADALQRALEALLARHESLRTRLVADDDGRPVQRIDDPAPPPLDRLDLTTLDGRTRQARLRRLLDTESVRPFVLAEGPLLRAHLVRMSATEHILMLVVHHAVFDGWSATVLIPELVALYGEHATGAPAKLPELPVQYADYAVWERDRLQGPVLEDLETYWRGVLDGFETVQFPTDRPRPVVDSFDGRLVNRTLGTEVLDGLRDLARREGTTPFVTLLAVLSVLLYRYTGQTDLMIGTASANRSRGELAPLIGFLVNTLPIRADLSGDPTFAELMGRIKETTLGCYAHQDLPFGKLVETVGVERDVSRAPLFQIGFTYAEPDHTPIEAGGVAFVLTDLIVGINAAKFDLTFAVEAREAGLWVEISYKTALFEDDTVRRLLGHLEVLLRGVLADPTATVSTLPVLSDEDLHRELVEWNDTATELPVTCIHRAVEDQVARTPDAVAAEFEDERVSYAELNRRANRIARRLRALGVGPERLVGVCMPARPDRLAALLGVLKAGGGYVPLDPALPADRLSFMVTDTGMAAVLTDAASRPALPDTGVPVVDLDADRAAIDALDGADLSGVDVTPSHVAYVIYTSGSTGQPKGVVVEHGQAGNFLHGMARQWHIGPSDVVLQFAAFTFDVSVMDMFLPLIAGARVVLAPAETLHAPPRLAALIRERNVTFACLPPAVLNLLVGEEFPRLRMLLSAGEELSSELLRSWLRPGLEIHNGYGPTEASIGATSTLLTADTPLPPPIGRPKPNYRVYVLDEHLNPVPVGVLGELHIGGPGVARGYLNRPELTQRRFIPDPFGPGRLYKTGDLVRRRADGVVVFVGRIDNQVKIHGLRVELGEIETALLSHPDVAQAVVGVHTDASGDKELVGYVRAVPGRPAPAAGELRGHVAATVPAYMVPAHMMVLDEFPVTVNGKIDRAALPEPDGSAEAEQVVPPATLIEVLLVDMFATLLGREQVGATDDFFDVGGNSLQAMRLINMVDGELAVGIGVTTVFLAPTPRQLAAVLRDEHGVQDEELGADGLAGLDELSNVG